MNKIKHILLSLILGMFFMIPVITLTGPTADKESAIVFLFYTFGLCVYSAYCFLESPDYFGGGDA